VYSDGGTEWIKIKDADGKHFDIFIDHRIGTKTPGVIYLIAYPGESKSVRVLEQHSFKQNIGDFE